MPVLTRRRRRLPDWPAGPVAFSFNGGLNWSAGTGAGIFATEPVFREAIERCAAVVREESDFDPLRVFTDGVLPSKRSEHICLMGVVQLAQAALWRSAGVAPDLTFGVSLGEAGAVYAAGGLDLDDGARVVAALGEASAYELVPHAMFTVETGPEIWADCAAAPVSMTVCGVSTHDRALVLAAVPDAPAARAYLEERHRVLHVREPVRPTHTLLAGSSRELMRRRLAGIVPRLPEVPCFLASAGRGVRADGQFDQRHWAWLHDHAFHVDESLDAAFELGPRLVVQFGEAATDASWTAAAKLAGRAIEIVHTHQADADETETWQRVQRWADERPRAEPPRMAPDSEIDLLAPHFARAPWTDLRNLGSGEGIRYMAGSNQWLVLDSDLIRDALSRPAEFSSTFWKERVDGVLLGAGAEAHTTARRQVAPLFSAALAAEDHASTTALGLMQDLASRVEFDVVGDLAIPVVHGATARMLGLDAERLLAGGRAVARGDLPTERAQVAFQSAGGPQDRVLPGGIEAPASLVRLLWYAGTVTTVRHIAWAVAELDGRRELRGRLRGDEAAMNSFLDEVLRLHPPEPLLERQTTSDVMLGDTAIPAEARVRLAIVLANRDPERFPDPDELVLGRPGGGLMTFGHGPHRCPGATLSRALTKATLGALLEEAPDWDQVVPLHAAPMATLHSAHGLSELRVSPRG